MGLSWHELSWLDLSLLLGPDWTCPNLTCPDLTGFKRCLVHQILCQKNVGPQKLEGPKTFLVPKNFWDFQTPFLYTYTPAQIGHLPDTFLVPSRHTLDTHQISASYVPLNYDFQLGRGVGGWFLLHNHATSWSNLQDCKISSRAEIPKLDRVWQ